MQARSKSGEVLQDQIHRELLNRSFQFRKRSQLFIGAHDETLSVTMRVHNPNCFASVAGHLRLGISDLVGLSQWSTA